MKQLFLMVNDGDVKLIDTPNPTVKANHVVVETLYSVVSAGTERSLASFGNKNLLQKALERPDQVKKVLEKVSTDGILTTLDLAFNKLNEPMPIGYSGMGKVIECGNGVTDVKVGDFVAMAGQAYHSEVNRVNKNLIAKIPNTFEDVRQGAFVALGGIALQGIHQAEVQPGETIAIIGLGLLGHITARILNAYGCDVIAFDINDKSIQNTRLKSFILSNDENAEDKVKALTKGRGVDKVIITAATSSNQPMDLAAAITRDRGIICMIGVTNMNIDRRPYYEKELTFTIARSYGPGRYESDYEEKGIDYPIGHIRFTEGRNLEEFIRLLVDQRIDLSDLITHEIDFYNAESAYELITTNKSNENYIGILLKYRESNLKFENTVNYNLIKKNKVKSNKISIGLIGSGNFVRSTMLPNMKKTNKYHFKALATTGGINSAQTVKMFNFEYSTNDYRKLLEDDSIDLIVVSTQHDSHAKFIIEALKHNKNVYCEKPLGLSLVELNEIHEIYSKSKGELFVGLNRKHSPLIKDIKKKYLSQTPSVYNYTVNAGFIPGGHWIQNEQTGGGRIIGEAIHFVDTIQYLDDSAIKEITINYANMDLVNNDNAIISLLFESGSIANVIYTSLGSKKYPKEHLLIHQSGKTIDMTNYLKISIYGSIRKNKVNLKQDKGFSNEFKYIYNVLKGKVDNQFINDEINNHRILLEAIRLTKSEHTYVKK